MNPMTAPDATTRRRPTAAIAVTAAMAVIAAVLLAAMLSSNTADAVLQEDPTPEPSTTETDPDAGDPDAADPDAGDRDDSDRDDGDRDDSDRGDSDRDDSHGDWDDSHGEWDMEWDMDVPPEFEAFEACANDIWDGNDESDVDEAELEARFEAECITLLPESEQAMIAKFGPFDDCLDAELGELTETDGFEIDHADFEAAEAACAELLPEEIRDLETAFEAFETCLADNGVPTFDEDELAEDGAVIFLVGPDGEQMISLGEGDATVTITSDGDSVTLETTGDASTIDIDVDHEAHDAAFEACESLLPDDNAMFFGIGDHDHDYDEED